MSDATSYVLKNVPWLGPFLSWLFAVLVTLLLLAIPAYFLLLPLFRRMRSETGEWAAELGALHRANRDSRRNRWLAAVDQYLNDNGLKRIRAGGSAVRAELASAVSRQVRRLRRKIAELVRLLEDLLNRATMLEEALKRAALTPGTVRGQIEPAQALAYQVAEVGVAWFELVIGLLLLVGMVAVNTIMLSQILRDLGVIPPSFAVLGIPLVYYLALLLSVAEAGLGFWHGTLMAPKKGDDEPRFSWAAALVIALPLFLSLFEGQNYGGIAPPAQTVNLPFFDFAMKKADLYFLLGFSIVWTLFGLGSVCYRAGVRVVKGGAPRRLVRQLEKAAKAEEVLSGARKAVQQGSSAAIDQDALDKLEAELDRIETAGAKAGAMEEKDLTRGEVIELAHLAGIWIVAGCVAVGIMTLTGMESFWAIGQALVFIAAGMLWASGETVAKGDTGAIIVSPRWSRALAILLATVLLALYVWGLVRSPARTRLAWTFSFVFGLALLAVASRLQPLLGVSALWLRGVGNGLVSVAEFLLRVIAHLLHAIAVVLEFISELLARPVLAFTGRRGGGSGASATAAAGR